MTKYDVTVQKRKSVLLATLVAIVSLAILLSFILMARDSLRNREVLETTQRYMTFESKVVQLIYANIALLKGFNAYIQFDTQFDEEHANRYLSYLLSDSAHYIRNIGVLEDTTLLWNYPRETNEEAIGVDLATIDTQRQAILQVREMQQAVFQGPIDLVQGGSGFSIRLPIVREDTGYWGQISIILQSEPLLEEISAYAKAGGLDIAISNQGGEGAPFFGSVVTSDKRLIFDVDPALINWRICINPGSIWLENPQILAALILCSAALSGALSMFVYQYARTHFKVLNISNQDYLTSLFNRRFLHERQAITLATARRQGFGAAILMFDIDHFKAINDTYGHEIGDKVLMETARLLRKETRKDALSFRFGGDEFVVLFPKISGEEDVAATRERLKQSFAEEFHMPDHLIQVELSFGYALFPEDGDDFDTLLREADQRLYREKAAHRQTERR